MRPVQTFSIIPHLPAEIEPLLTLAYNLRWCWSHETIELFRRLDRDLWETAGHNPVLLLGTIEQQKLEAAARDEAFLAHLHRVECEPANLHDRREGTWFCQHPRAQSRIAPLIAYFSAEFGLTECLSIFAGGLGILGGRPSEVGQRSGCAAGRRRPALSAGILPPVPEPVGLAAGSLRRQRLP